MTYDVESAFFRIRGAPAAASATAEEVVVAIIVPFVIQIGSAAAPTASAVVPGAAATTITAAAVGATAAPEKTPRPTEPSAAGRALPTGAPATAAVWGTTATSGSVKLARPTAFAIAAYRATPTATTAASTVARTEASAAATACNDHAVLELVAALPHVGSPSSAAQATRTVTDAPTPSVIASAVIGCCAADCDR
jgi:hypothetical protein